MQKLERLEHFREVKRHSCRDLLVENSDLAQQRASLYVLKLKIQILVILEGAENIHYKRAPVLPESLISKL